MNETKGSTDGSFGERARYIFDDFTVDLARAELVRAASGRVCGRNPSTRYGI
jgi:hypothetical protein